MDSRTKKLVEAIQKVLPIVEAAYWDHHTAGVLPGSGYNNKAQHLAGQAWGWRDSKPFKDWLSELKASFESQPEVKADPSISKDEAHLFIDGKLVGKIVNLSQPDVKARGNGDVVLSKDEVEHIKELAANDLHEGYCGEINEYTGEKLTCDACAIVKILDRAMGAK